MEFFGRDIRDRLILIAPPLGGLLRGAPNGLIDIANFVSAQLPETDVRLVDLSDFAETDVPDVLVRELEDSDVRCWVGITATTASYQSARRTAAAAKLLRPDVVVVLGGPHASADGIQVLKNEENTGIIDFVVQGEGERSLTALLRRHPDVSRVPGLIYRVGHDVRANPSAPRLTQPELDELPITFRGAGLERNPGKFGTVTYVSARGCPLQCAFCSVADQAITHKSVGRVVQDLLSVSARHGFKRIAIEDNFFAHSLGRTVSLCQRLAELRESGTLPIRWDCQTRVESLKRVATLNDGSGGEKRVSIIELMEKAGCEAVYVGVESVVPAHLRYLRKTHRPEAYVQDLLEVVIPRLLVSKIEAYVNLQLGLPQETEADHERTLAMLRTLGEMARRAGRIITVFPQLHVVYPGTGHFAEGVEQGRFPRDVFEAFTEWEASQQPILRWLGEHFAHGTGGLPEGILDPQALRDGRFRVLSDRVETVDRMLRRMAAVDGIQVFQYGKHLVGTVEVETNEQRQRAAREE